MVARDKGKGKKGFFSRFFVIVVILLSILLIFGIAREYMRRKDMDKEITQLEEELEKLKLKKKDFLSSIESYDSEFFVEQEARMKFDMKKPNEQVVIIPVGGIPTDLNNNNVVLDNNKNIDQSHLNIILWWQYFFGNQS